MVGKKCLHSGGKETHDIPMLDIQQAAELKRIKSLLTGYLEQYSKETGKL